MRILLTNDDGIFAPGLDVLERIARQFSDDIWIVAPSEEQSGAGHSLTLSRPVRLRQHGELRFSVSGTPTDAVMMALRTVMPGAPDLLLSGVNRGANLGDDVTYSGTVTAAMEAVITGIPGVAVSLELHEGHIGPIDYSASTYAARVAVENVFAHGLPEDTLLNVNIPFLKKEELKGFRVTRQGLRVYHSRLDERLDPRNRPYYWIGGDAPTGVPESGTDVGALSEGYISVSPLQLDLTAYRALSDISTWEWK